MSGLFIFIIIILLAYYYRSLVTQTDPFLAKPYVDILLPEFTHQETLLFSQFLYSGELRYKEGGESIDLYLGEGFCRYIFGGFCRF